MVDETPAADTPTADESDWSRYIRPKSLTWWASVTPLLAGVALAFADAFNLQPVKDLIGAFAPGVGPGMLINLGLIGIGLRSAIK